ncbi:MAG: RibD family protein [Thermoleophilia bacterium]|nr:RibD family protein [Thermoleophilia bacterium]
MAGIKVDLAGGELALRARRQNNGFRKTAVVGLPFVTYKYAMTLDGRVATDAGDSRWVSGEESRALVHEMRSWVDAVMVGAGTLHRDDPRLTARPLARPPVEPAAGTSGCKKQPLRVVVDSGLKLPRQATLVQSVKEGPVLVVCGDRVPKQRRAEVQTWGVEVAAVEGEEGRPAPRAVAALLAQRGVQHVLLEGGPTLAGAWWEAGLIDQVMAFVSPRLVGGRECRAPLWGSGRQTMGEAWDLRETEVKQCGRDVLITGYLTEAY